MINEQLEEQENKPIYLCYIEYIHSIDNEYQYLFYFCEQEHLNDVVGPNWDLPCADVVKPPYKKYITEIWIAKTKRINFELLEANDFYCYTDGADNVIALMWEVNENNNFSSRRLVFQFGETIDKIEDKMFSKEIIFTLCKS